MSVSAVRLDVSGISRLCDSNAAQQQVKQMCVAALQGFEPLELAQHAGKRLLRFSTFDAALDEYFSKVCVPRIGWLSGRSAVCSKHGVINPHHGGTFWRVSSATRK